MSESYRLPRAKVLALLIDSDITTCVIEVSREDYLSYPIAPCNLQNDAGYIFLFHQLVARDGTKLTLETYQVDQPLPNVGDEYEFLSNWIPNAMDAVLDMEAKWVHKIYPNNGDHNHCLLTYVTISAHSEHKEGYCSEHGWVTVDAYQKFIEKDQLRVRSHWRSIENPFN